MRESGHWPDRTHNPFDESYRVSGLRENLTSRSNGAGLETGRRNTLNGHAGGNPSYSQGQSYGLPRQSFTRQIVFTQMTKADVFAGRAGGDHVADFDLVVGDNDSINQQFDQHPFLLEGRLS